MQSLGGLMDAAYRNKKDIRERVAAVVSTYTPERIQDPMQETQKDSSTSVVKMKIHPYEKAEEAEKLKRLKKAEEVEKAKKAEEAEKAEEVEKAKKAEEA